MQEGEAVRVAQGNGSNLYLAGLGFSRLKPVLDATLAKTVKNWLKPSESCASMAKSIP